MVFSRTYTKQKKLIEQKNLIDLITRPKSGIQSYKKRKHYSHISNIIQSYIKI